MHTSTRLTNADFKFWQQATDEQSVSISFAEFCPDYHQLDRVGIVSPRLNDGVLGAGQSVLALTTAFYDCHREQSTDFFDYPQHFAFVGSDSVCHPAEDMTPWTPWSKLDVWPENKWLTIAPTTTDMLQAVFDYQINRLFWPQNFWPYPIEEPLPDYAYRMLQTRLKSVYIYHLADKSANAKKESDHSTIEVLGSSAVKSVLQESMDHLPNSPQTTEDATELLQPVAVAEFMAKIQLSYQPAKTSSSGA